jgi:two-component system alkaline phosphatase synthesis response regulator PhoP
MSKSTVLVIDDEKDLLELVRYNLEKEHFAVVVASDSSKGLEIAQRNSPDLLILDLMMPGLGGLEICRQLRGEPATARIPILMLTAKAAETDRVIGLEMGADDYLTKPFSPRELVARVRAILRRSAAEQPAAQIIRRGELLIDIPRHEVKLAGKTIGLTATEFRILEFLAARPGRVLSRDQIIDAALGQSAAVIDRTIDVHITSLRKKLGAGGAKIETVRGFGYKFREDASEEANST